VIGNREFTASELRGAEVTFAKDATLTFAKVGLAGQTCFVVTLDPDKSPRQMCLYPNTKGEEKCLRAVYRIDKDGRLEMSCYDSFATQTHPQTLGPVGPQTGRYLVLERADKPLPPVEPADQKNVERPKLPDDQAKIVREQFAGTWQVESGERAGKELTAWERRGFLMSISTDGKFTVHRGEVAGRREFLCTLDLAVSPPTLNLTAPNDPAGRLVHMAYEFKDGKLSLRWRDFPADPKPRMDAETKGAARHLTLTRHGAMTAEGSRPMGLAVKPDPQNVVASHLEGRWWFDDAMSRRLAGADPAKWQDVSRVEVKFTNDPAVAGQVPAAYRELLAGKRVYMAGQMTSQNWRLVRGGRPTTTPFVLIEHAGNPVLVSFDQVGDRPWAKEQATVVNLVPAASSGDDLLFLSPLEPGDGEHAGALRRVTGRR
jgi:uncharacterized protein (TIGR03067 family)